ncbi:hypothetical protein OSB04_016414 [Centaurea solstitialis]|uniref:BED-type domain-containing protein n=1 Tax=Centaurea solstitialis TaxID=347529 RepID=A0AA38T2I8_9ASTR|nr:hypothetical protein OSB04_016414 [Centaurea solstitialis]
MTSASQSQHSLAETQGSTINQPPLWDNVTKLEKLAGLGGSWKFKCNFCNESRQGSYSRVRAHLLGIKGNLLISIFKDHVLGFLFARKQQRLTKLT